MNRKKEVTQSLTLQNVFEPTVGLGQKVYFINKDRKIECRKVCLVQLEYKPSRDEYGYPNYDRPTYEEQVCLVAHEGMSGENTLLVSISNVFLSAEEAAEYLKERVLKEFK